MRSGATAANGHRKPDGRNRSYLPGTVTFCEAAWTPLSPSGEEGATLSWAARKCGSTELPLPLHPETHTVRFSLLPREEKFFDLFVEVARRSHQAAGHLVGLFTEPEKAKYHAE